MGHIKQRARRNHARKICRLRCKDLGVVASYWEQSRADVCKKKKRERQNKKTSNLFRFSSWAEAALTFCEHVDAVGVVVGAYDPVGNAEVERIVGRGVGQCVLFFQRRKIRSSYILLSAPFIFIKQHYGRATAAVTALPIAVPAWLHFGAKAAMRKRVRMRASNDELWLREGQGSCRSGF